MRRHKNRCYDDLGAGYTQKGISCTVYRTDNLEANKTQAPASVYMDVREAYTSHHRCVQLLSLHDASLSTIKPLSYII